MKHGRRILTADRRTGHGRGQLSVVQTILLKASRIIFPSSMRLEILDKIHEGNLARNHLMPGAGKKVCLVAWTCRTCNNAATEKQTRNPMEM